MVKITTIFYALVVLGGLLAPANAVPTVDGRFDPGEGYTIGYYVNFELEGGKNQPLIPVSGQGRLWRHQDASGNLYVAFIQPVTLIDNSYGANVVNWPKEHTFDHLRKSDKVVFEIKDGSGNMLFGFEIDYFNDSFVAELKGDYANYIDVASSLEYNFNAYYPDLSLDLTDKSPAADNNYNVTDLAYSDWVFEVIYEFKIDGSLFAENGFGSLTIPILHDSPNKIGGNKVYPQVDGVIPEPTTVVLTNLGIGLVIWLRRRKTL